jgi:hypothetical protein
MTKVSGPRVYLTSLAGKRVWALAACQSLTLPAQAINRCFLEKSAQGEAQGELYQTRLSRLLDQSHPLKVLAEAIDWQFFEGEFGRSTWRGRGCRDWRCGCWWDCTT